MHRSTVGSQRVPGIVVLYCNLMVGHTAFARAQTHTHTPPSILLLLKAPVKGSFWNLPEFGRHIRFDHLYVCETCHLEAYFQSREQSKVTRNEIRRVRWLGDDINFFSVRNCCTIHGMWLGAWSWCRNRSLRLVASLTSNCIAQPLQNLHVEMTSKTLFTRYAPMMHQLVDV
jgi:hypothetical protein